MKWSYAVMTVPSRRHTLLPRTLASLRDAGFDKPRLCVDGGTAADLTGWYDQFPNSEITLRIPRIGVAFNWMMALWEIYYRNPNDDRYAVFQDDFVTYRNLRTYLDQYLMPEKSYWNLYTFPSNQSICPIDNRTGCQQIGWFKSNQLGRGAVALVFSRDGVATLLSSPHMATRPQNPNRGWRAIDGGVAESMKIAGWTEWVHNPSLIQHTGEITTMNKAKNNALNSHPPSNFRWPADGYAVSFRGEAFDAMTILKETAK